MPPPPVIPAVDLHRATVEIQTMPHCVVVALSGDHDLSTKPQLLELLARVSRQQRVVIDLRHCTFVDSTIIGAILTACAGDSSREPTVSVVLPPDTSYVYRALSVIGLRDLVPTHLSIEAALEARARRAEPVGRQHASE